MQAHKFFYEESIVLQWLNSWLSHSYQNLWPFHKRLKLQKKLYLINVYSVNVYKNLTLHVILSKNVFPLIFYKQKLALYVHNITPVAFYLSKNFSRHK